MSQCVRTVTHPNWTISASGDSLSQGDIALCILESPAPRNYSVIQIGDGSCHLNGSKCTSLVTLSLYDSKVAYFQGSVTHHTHDPD